MSFTTVSDLAYGDHHLQRVDIHRPDSDTPVPTVVYLHGGGFVQGDKANEIAPRIATVVEHGVAVVSANYRLAPDWRYPAQVQDAKAAVAWVRSHGAEHGLAVERVGVWGASVGGYLASMVALTSGDPALDGDLDPAATRVDAIVSWFGASDLWAGARRSGLEEIAFPIAVEKNLFGLDDITGRQAELAAASPLNRVRGDAPAFLIAHGDRDRITPFHASRSLHDRLAQAGVTSTLVTVGGAGHEDRAFDSAAHLGMTAAFLRATLEPPLSDTSRS